MSTSDAESDVPESVQGSPPSVPLRTKLREVFKSTWDDFYDWAPPRTLPLRTTVLPEIRASEHTQAASLKEMIAQAQAAKAARAQEAREEEIHRNGFEYMTNVNRQTVNQSTLWVRYGAIPREEKESNRGESVATETSGRSSGIPGPLSTAGRPVHTMQKPGVAEAYWLCTNKVATGPVRPVPAYTFCQYSEVNATNADSKRQQFLPTFDDDVDFDQDMYAELYKLAPEWMEQDRDPDVDIILVETIQRVREELKHGKSSYSKQKYNFTRDSLDATRVLPQTGAAIEDRELGRTLPAFPSRPTLDETRDPDLRIWRSRPEILDIELAEETALLDWMDLACPADTCVTVCCQTHIRYTDQGDGGKRKQQPRCTPLPASYRKRPAKACSGDCFVEMPISQQPLFPGDKWYISPRNVPEWRTADRQRLCKVLEKRPGDAAQNDLVPCHLRVLFPGMTCNMIARQIAFLVAKSIERDKLRPTPEPTSGHARRFPFIDRDVRRANYNRCHHDGPCVSGVCDCATLLIVCEKHCRCDDDCARRFPGCNCARDGKGACLTNKCACIKAGRSCDPKLCLGCGAAEVTQRPNVTSGVLTPDGHWKPHAKSTVLNAEDRQQRCQNVHLLSDQRAKVRVDASPVAGYGLFADEVIEKGATVIEYVGDLIAAREADRRDLIYTVTKRNYLFELDTRRLIDAAHNGNLARFVNHAGTQANCSITITNVLGDYRIRFHANRRIQQHEELFIDYGDYFSKDQAGVRLPPNRPKAAPAVRTAQQVAHAPTPTASTLAQQKSVLQRQATPVGSRSSAPPPSTRKPRKALPSTKSLPIADAARDLRAAKRRLHLREGRGASASPGGSASPGPAPSPNTVWTTARELSPEIGLQPVVRPSLVAVLGSAAAPSPEEASKLPVAITVSDSSNETLQLEPFELLAATAAVDLEACEACQQTDSTRAQTDRAKLGAAARCVRCITLGTVYDHAGQSAGPAAKRAHEGAGLAEPKRARVGASFNADGPSPSAAGEIGPGSASAALDIIDQTSL